MSTKEADLGKFARLAVQVGELVDEKNKICKTCGLQKKVKEFYRKKISKDGWQHHCKVCAKRYQKQFYALPEKAANKKEQAKQYYKNNKEVVLKKVQEYRCRAEIKGKIKQYNRQKLLLHPENALLTHARKRAAKFKIPFSLTLDDITIPFVCPVLGILLKHGEGTVHDNSPTLDRFVPELGYVPGNVTVMSKRANTLKSNGTLEEHIKIVQWLDEMLGND